MESQSQNPEFRINPENFHLCNSSGSKRDIARAQNSRESPMTFNCDLELESTQLSHGFCIPSD